MTSPTWILIYPFALQCYVAGHGIRALRSLIVFFPLAFLLPWVPVHPRQNPLVRTSGGINSLGPARCRRGILFPFVGLRIT